MITGKGAQAHGIALAQGHVTEQQAGIERVIEVRQFIVLTAHASATVEHEDDLLVAFVLIFAGNRCALAGGGFPVDLTQTVALTKFTQLVKLQPLAATLPLAHAELAEPVVYRQ